MNTKSLYGVSTIHHATLYNNSSMIQLFIDRGADVNGPCDHWGMTPLHRAAGNGYTDSVKCLIRNGADTNIKDTSGLTPLDVALNSGHHHIVDILRKNYNHASSIL